MKKKRIAPVLAIILTAFMITVFVYGCSGGGGGGSTGTAPVPSATPSASPSPSPSPTAGWLSYLNNIRAVGGLPAVTENSSWTDGIYKHAIYMVKNDVIGHSEDPANPYYTPEGDTAAANCNLYASSSTSGNYENSIDSWLVGPFHGVGMLDPRLLQSAFADYSEADGGLQYGSGLDVLRGTGSLPSGVTFPIMWPGNGSTMPVDSYDGNESPDPLTSSPGYSAPTGPPIYLMLGTGGVTPNVTASSFKQGSTDLDHFTFDETNYTNPDGSAQSTGRAVLNSRDCIVLMPKDPLQAGQTYTVSITNDGSQYTWSFTVSNSPKSPMKFAPGIVK